MESLEIASGGAVRSVTLSGDRVTIGRGEGNDVVITGDARASREHAVLTKDGTIWQIADRKSMNGTYVNSVRISKPVHLSEGDRIHVGATVLTLQVHDEVVVRPRTIDLGTSAKVGDVVLSDDDRRLLALLAKGATDREIASVLNITTHEATEAVTDLAFRTSVARRIDLARLGVDLSMS
ncbi:MAG: FHA domain-containing protein [Candidatus Nanopelagicales bacterium]